MKKSWERKKGGAGQSFLHGALILTAGMAAVKVIGALFKIPLKYAIGEYGMGLFNVAYNFYGPVFSLATAGFPIAVSRLVAESGSLGRWNDVRAVKRAAAPLFLAFGGLGMVLMTLAAPAYCGRMIGNDNALYPMLALAPAVLFACLGSVYRGYYEGLRDMIPTAVSEIVEALVKLGLGLSAACWVVSRGSEEYALRGTVFGKLPASSDEAVFLTLALAAAAAVLGVTCGSAASLLYLALRHKLRGDEITPQMQKQSPPARSGRKTVRRLLSITAPVAVGSVAMNVAGLIDATFLQSRIRDLMASQPQRLLAACQGMIPRVYLENPQTIPTFLYGCYTLAMTIYLLVPAITQAFGISALPTVTEAWTRKDRKELRERMGSVLRITALFCFPAGLGVSALAEPITRLLYGADESAPLIAGALSLLGVASLAAAMSTPLSSMLQAVGRADLPVKLLAVAMVFKIVVNWALCGIPELNIQGAGVGTLVCYLFLAGAQFFCLRRVTKVPLSMGELFFKPLCCAALCGCAAKAAFSPLASLWAEISGGEILATAAAVLVGACMYGVGLLLLGGIRKSDVFLLPKGQKIAKTLEKQRWI